MRAPIAILVLAALLTACGGAAATVAPAYTTAEALAAWHDHGLYAEAASVKGQGYPALTADAPNAREAVVISFNQVGAANQFGLTVFATHQEALDYATGSRNLTYPRHYVHRNLAIGYSDANSAVVQFYLLMLTDSLR